MTVIQLNAMQNSAIVMRPDVTIRAALLKMVFPSILVLFASSPRLVDAQEKPALSVPCGGPEYRQFDFWVGDWDAFESDGVTKAAHVRVDRTLDGCTLHEHYEDYKGLQGDSISVYDRSRSVWHQTWVTNKGQLLSIEGRMQAGAMVLNGSSRAVNGGETLVRGTWKPRGDGVRETAVTSTDRGRTWKPWFDLLFRPRGAGAPTNEDAKTVARLDTDYQAAVKENDAATMDRILADDFVLVTGAGKVFSKADLIEEARAVRTTYERQEDAEQVVRIWGDTAVVTAKLWEKGVTSGKPFDSTLWFSDTYVRTPAGWRYVFGQASLPLGNVEKREASYLNGMTTGRPKR